jgi:hypothetical protein
MGFFDKKVDYDKLVKRINSAANLKFGFTKPFFDQGNYNRNLINVYASELSTCIGIMNNENLQKKEGIVKVELMRKLDGAKEANERFIKLHAKMKEMYVLAFSLARKEIDDAYKNYVLLEAKYGNLQSGAGKGNSQADAIRIRMDNARGDLMSIQGGPSFRYITGWYKDGEILTAYNDAISTLRGVFKNLGMHVDF